MKLGLQIRIVLKLRLAEAWADKWDGAGSRDEYEAGLGPGLERALELEMWLYGGC